MWKLVCCCVFLEKLIAVSAKILPQAHVLTGLTAEVPQLSAKLLGYAAEAAKHRRAEGAQRIQELHQRQLPPSRAHRQPFRGTCGARQATTAHGFGGYTRFSVMGTGNADNLNAIILVQAGFKQEDIFWWRLEETSAVGGTGIGIRRCTAMLRAMFTCQYWKRWVCANPRPYEHGRD